MSYAIRSIGVLTYLYDFGLANAMSASNCLEIVLRIPVSVDHDNMRSASEIDTEPASLGGDKIHRVGYDMFSNQRRVGDIEPALTGVLLLELHRFG